MDDGTPLSALAPDEAIPLIIFNEEKRRKLPIEFDRF